MEKVRNFKLKSCTDLLWICLFLVFCMLLMCLAVIFMKHKSIDVIMKGYDSFGNICGSNVNRHYENFTQSARNTSLKPYLYYLDIDDIPMVFKVCIDNCEINPRISEPVVIEFWKEIETMDCQYHTEGINLNALRYCPTLNLFNSKIYRHRCIPTTDIEHAKKIFRDVSAKSFTEMFFMAFYLTWPYVLVLCGIALFLSILLWTIVNFLTHIICWIISTLVIFCTAGLCLVFLYENYKLPPQYNNENFNDFDAMQHNFLEEAKVNRIILRVFSIILLFLMILLFFLLFHLRKYFPEVALLLKETINFSWKLKKLLVIPLVSLLLNMVVLSFGSYVMLCLATASYPKILPIKVKNENSARHVVEYVQETNIRNLVWVYKIGLLWITEFIVAAEQFIVSASTVHLYYQLPGNSYGQNFTLQLMKHHLGSIAKGSFLYTFFKIPRFIIMKGGKLLNQINFKTCTENDMEKLEEKMECFNPIAYTIVAMEQIELCPAGRKIWKIMKKSPTQLKVVKNMSIFILFLIKLIVVFITCFVGVFMLHDLNNMYFFMAPLILTAIFGYCIANLIFSFLEIILGTICLCVCDESGINSKVDRWTKNNLASLLEQKRINIHEAPITITNA